jgi:hypothetical protein
VVNAATNDTVVVDSAADGTAYVTASGRTSTFSPGVLQSIAINAYGGQNTIRVLSVPSGVGVSVQGWYGGVDNVTIGNGTLASVGGPVSVSNTSGNITVDDSADAAGRAVTVTNSSVQFAGLSPVTYSGTNSSLTVRGGSGTNSFAVLSTAGGTPLSVVTGAGQNAVSVGNNGSLAGIAAAVNVQHNSGSGSTSLTVDDHNEYGRSADVNSGQVAFTGVAPVTYSNIDSLSVVGASGYNWIEVDSVPSGVPVTIYNTECNYVYGAAWWQVTQVYYPAYYVNYGAYGYFVG